MSADKGWHRTFDDPIPLLDGGELHTLRDAGNYIAKLPKREQDSFAWRVAIQALMLVVEHGGDTMLPRQASAAAHQIGNKTGVGAYLARRECKGTAEMNRYFFGIAGSQNVEDGQDLTFESDLAAFEAARWLAARLSSRHPELRGNTSVVAMRKDQGEAYYVSL